jgi:hypothetical protein
MRCAGSPTPPCGGSGPVAVRRSCAPNPGLHRERSLRELRCDYTGASISRPAQVRAAARPSSRRHQLTQVQRTGAAGADAATTERRPHGVMPFGGTRDRKPREPGGAQRTSSSLGPSVEGRQSSGLGEKPRVEARRVQPPRGEEVQEEDLGPPPAKRSAIDPKERSARSSHRTPAPRSGTEAKRSEEGRPPQRDGPAAKEPARQRGIRRNATSSLRCKGLEQLAPTLRPQSVDPTG